MAKQKTQKFELATLNANNLKELDGWKVKMETAVKDFPFIEIADTKSYEEAKANRTGLRTTRTDVQKQDKLIGSFVTKFRKDTKVINETLVAVVLPGEEKQQAEIDRWENILEAKRKEKQLEEENRVKKLNDQIVDLKEQLNTQIELMTFETIGESKVVFDDIIQGNEIDFEEFMVLWDEIVNEKSIEFENEVSRLQDAENFRLEQLKKDQEAKINEIHLQAIQILDDCEMDDADQLDVVIGKLIETDFDFGEFNQKWKTTCDGIVTKTMKRMDEWTNEKKRRKEIEKQEDINRINEVREGLLDFVFQMDVDNYQTNLSAVEAGLNQKNPFPELKEEFNTMISTVKKNLDSKTKMINAEIQQAKNKEKAEEERMEMVMNHRSSVLKDIGLIEMNDGNEHFFQGFGLKYDVSHIYECEDLENIVEEIEDWKNQLEEIKERTIYRGKQLEGIGFVFNKQKSENFWNTLISDFEVWESMVEGLSDEEWKPYFEGIEKEMEEAKEKNKAFQERQKRLITDKKIMVAELEDLLDSYAPNPGDYDNEECLHLAKEIYSQLKMFVDAKVQTINKF